MKLIIQVPAYNEATTLAQTLRELPRQLEGISVIETLVIDDGSTDGTADAARKAGATHVVQLKTHRGLSAAFVAGIDAALRLGADVIVNTDADNQYQAADIAKLVAPIVRGNAEVVIGDRDVASSPHMSGLKKTLQRLGSWTVGLASGVEVSDVTSGFRAFSRDAAMQINVFNPFTYTLETVIQAGNRNLGVQSVRIRTNAPTRPSRLYRGIGTYMRKSMATIFRIYALYRPLKTFFAIGSLLMLAGVALGGRFLFYFLRDNASGHVQSLILAAVFLITGFHTWLIALLADLIAVNRRLTEDVLVRVKQIESGAPRKEQRPPLAAGAPQRDRAARPPRPLRRGEQPAPQGDPLATASRKQPAPTAQAAPKAAAPAQTQWVWLIDEDKLDDRAATPTATPAPSPAMTTSPEPDDVEESDAADAANPARRRRRRRGGANRPRADRPELPGNRGKHLTDDE